MKTVYLYYAVGAAVLIFLWIILNRWSERRARSPSTQNLKKTGEELLAQNRALSEQDVVGQLKQLIGRGSVKTVDNSPTEALPIELQMMKGNTRELLTAHRAISVPESSIEVGREWLRAGVGAFSLRIGHSADRLEDVLTNPVTGEVAVGDEVFPSLAHFLVFVSE